MSVEDERLYHTDYPTPPSMSHWVALGPRFPSTGLSPAAIGTGLCCPALLPGLRDHAQHRVPSLESEHRSGLAHVFILLSHLQTQAALLRKGRLRLPGRKAGLMSAAQSWALGSLQLGNCPMSQGPSWHPTWWPWLTPRCLGEALLEAALVQGFIAGEPRFSNLVSEMMALSERGLVVSTLLR